MESALLDAFFVGGLNNHQTKQYTVKWYQIHFYSSSNSMMPRIQNSIKQVDNKFSVTMFGNIMLSHRPQVDLVAILKAQLSNSLWKIVAWALAIYMQLLSCECHRISLMISLCWLRYWLGGIRQQVITWANVDPTSCCHMASLGHTELTGFMFWVRSRTTPTINAICGILWILKCYHKIMGQRDQ